MECLFCGKTVKNKYCSVSCQNKHQNTARADKKYGKKIKFQTTCFKCGKEIEINVRKCQLKERYFCNRSCANSRIFTEELINKIWTDEKKLKASIKSKKSNEKYWTIDKRNEHSNRMLEIVKQNPESYSSNNVSGRVKIIDYNGIKLKGNWELLVAKTLDNEKIKWTNKIKPIPYFWKNSWHLYFPDFYLLDYNIYLEVKGYKREKDEAKWDSVKGKIIILQNKEIKYIKKNKLNLKSMIDSIIISSSPFYGTCIYAGIYSSML